MKITIINLTHGNLHLDSLEMYIIPGHPKHFHKSKAEILSICPELISFIAAGYVHVIESAPVMVETKTVNAASVVEPIVAPVVEAPPASKKQKVKKKKPEEEVQEEPKVEPLVEEVK